MNIPVRRNSGNRDPPFVSTSVPNRPVIPWLEDEDLREQRVSFDDILLEEMKRLTLDLVPPKFEWKRGERSQ